MSRGKLKIKKEKTACMNVLNDQPSVDKLHESGSKGI